MTPLFKAFLPLFVFSMFAGCGVVFNSDGQPASPAGGSESPATGDERGNPSLPRLSFKSTTLGLEPVVDQSARTIVLSDLPAGRIFSFSLLENDLAAENFYCSNLPDLSVINQNRLHIDLGLTEASGVHSLNCTTSNGALTIQLGYGAASLALLSSSFNETITGGISASAPAQTADGNISVWVESGRTLSRFSQVMLKDHITGEIRVVSETSSGEFGNATSSAPQISSDGRYVVFYSSATNLVTGASGYQIYRKDLQTGALVLVSSTDGSAASKADGYSDSPQISPDGRYVVFYSTSANLVAGADGEQIYRKDLQTGDLMLVSSAASGGAEHQGDGGSYTPQISSDGRYVVFYSTSTNFVVGASGQQIYRKDLQAGDLVLVSSRDGSAENKGDGYSDSPQISSDGRYVVFYSTSTNLVGAIDGHIYLKDLQTGSIVLVSSTDGSAEYRGNGDSYSPQLSSDGRYVVFHSSATNLVTGASGTQVYRKDLQTGSIVLVSSGDGSAENQGNGGYSGSVQFTSDGRYVVFRSNATNFVAGASGFQIYRKDLQTGSIVLVSSTDGSAANQGNSSSGSAQLTPDGRYLVFLSQATNLVMGASGFQIYRKDLQTGSIVLVSSADGSAANKGNSYSFSPQITSDGRYVVFRSEATNLVAGASGYQIYRKDLQSGTLVLVSSTDGSTANRGNGDSHSTQITSDGRYVVFESLATSLVPGASGRQIYRKDIQTGALVLVSSTDGSVANQGNGDSFSTQITSDGRYVVFLSQATNLVPGASGRQIYRKDLQTGALVLVSSIDGSVVNKGNIDSYSPQITSDGRYVVFQTASTNLVVGASGTQIYRKDIQTGALVLVSSIDGTAANQGSSVSYSSQITSDGRYVAFYSGATNLVVGASGTQIYRKDLQTGAIVLVSSTDGSPANQGDGGSYTPQISSDGRYVAFQSSATNLVTGASGEQIYLKRIP